MTAPGTHPVWCERSEANSGMPRHRSLVVRVGARRPGRLADRGEVSARLTATGLGPAWVTVNAAHMTGVTVDLSIADATVLRDGLSRLLRAAGSE